MKIRKETVSGNGMTVISTLVHDEPETHWGAIDYSDDKYAVSISAILKPVESEASNE